mmetsp:Transcript_4660/g.5235  ORF Transcript_4660/g.5235 Transcript_4660/m.5235 type:complete len:259 (+) Transcript_4660:64-840(+)
MTASKRKNEDVDCVVNQLTKMVIVSNNDGEENNTQSGPPAATVLEITMKKMEKLTAQWKQEIPLGCITTSDDTNEINPYDDIAQVICTIVDDNKNNIDLEDSLLQEAGKVKSNLSQGIQQAKDLRSKETNVLSDLSEQLTKFQETRRDLLREIEELDDRQRVSQKNISIYQAEASQELDIITDVEEQQKRQVPRLKMLVSLYASTTGIKWDFADSDLLSGQMAVPSQNAFKLFTIDPVDYSTVETADLLWGMMEGNDV